MTDCRFCMAGKRAFPIRQRQHIYSNPQEPVNSDDEGRTSSAGRPTALSTITMVTRPPGAHRQLRCWRRCGSDTTDKTHQHKRS